MIKLLIIDQAITNNKARCVYERRNTSHIYNFLLFKKM